MYTLKFLFYLHGFWALLWTERDGSSNEVYIVPGSEELDMDQCKVE